MEEVLVEEVYLSQEGLKLSLGRVEEGVSQKSGVGFPGHAGHAEVGEHEFREKSSSV